MTIRTSTTTRLMAETTSVLLDCDPGHDDAIAILLAAGDPRCDLRAVTTVAGNASLEKVTLNARRVMTLAGLRDVPLAAGAAGPLRGPLVTAPEIHGDSGLDGAVLPDPEVAVDPRPAVELLEGSLPATLVATGPLTNIAQLLERAPGAVGEIVWMGGSSGRGNVRPYAEFNAFVDPEAAAAVFASGARLTMVGLDLTHQAPATPEVFARLRALDSEVATVVADWLEAFAAGYRSVFGLPGPPMHDPCALALALDPAIATCQDAFVAVETTGEWTRGATVVDLHGRLGREPNARVARKLDVARFWDVLIGAIAAL
jgi:purine nucleosidase/pyrimidine-specific ribonucleoside hydrolase